VRAPAPDEDHRTLLGSRLRLARLDAHLTLRDVARELGVSASFVSQLENGKSQPSVATLSALTRLLGMSLDRLFEDRVALPADSGPAVPDVVDAPAAMAATPHTPVQPVLHPPPRVTPSTDRARLSVTRPGNRPRLVMTSGVVWEELARTDDRHVEFIEVSYPPGSSSTVEDRMLRHHGYEYGYLLEGQLRVMVGSTEITLRAGEAIELDAALPHLVKNVGTTPARGVWFLHHRHD
jgi:DNA-binding XRE family transcriptional regulator/quercetin dioxygenase-like cupin family protein